MTHRHLRRYLRHGMLPQLAVFEAVARHASFTRAAEELHMAQPTVSVQVKKLAETVGLPLFELVGKRVHLTAAGRELQAACSGVFRGIAEIEERLARLRSAGAGSLRIAVGTAASSFAPLLVRRFLDRYPGATVALGVHNREQLLDRLARNCDDFYVLSAPPEDVDLAAHPILPNPLSIYARADHPLAGRSGLGLCELACEPLLLREPGSGTRRRAEALLADHGVAPEATLELGSNEAIVQGVLSGLGLALLPGHALGPAMRRDGIAALDVTGLPVPGWWYLVHPAGKRLSPTAAAFVDEARRPDERSAAAPVPEVAA